VNSEVPENTIVEQVLNGDNREIQLLVARGLFPLPPQELIPLQVTLSKWDDPELAAAARESLQGLEPKIAAYVLAESSDAALFAYFVEQDSHPVIVEAILRNRHVSPEVLGQIAPLLSPELQEVLLLRQDVIVEHAWVLDRLEENPELSTYVERRVHEYREHLVREEIEPQVEEVEEEETEREATDEEVETAIAEAKDLPEQGEADEVTGLTEAQIRSLPIPVRLKLARGAPRSLRNILVKDKNPLVAMSVMHGSSLSESEVELIAASRAVVEEVLNVIARDRQWNRKYSIIHALIRNPRTSVGLAVRLTPRLSARDLRNLSRDRNVPEAVRNHAARLYRIKAI